MDAVYNKANFHRLCARQPYDCHDGNQEHPGTDSRQGREDLQSRYRRCRPCVGVQQVYEVIPPSRRTERALKEFS
jgi:hypothetical protein